MTSPALNLPTVATRRRPRHHEQLRADRWSAERRRILEQLRARGPRTIPELVSAWTLAPALVGTWFARLEQDGLVWRAPGDAPGMLPRYGLTFAARRLMRRVGVRRRWRSVARVRVARGEGTR